jgi:putative transposase
MTLRQARWIITKWIVDVYHMDQHSKTGEAPADGWKRGVWACGEKLPPPEGLLVPLTGMVIPGTLNREGIRFHGLCWNSNEFSLLRNRIGKNPDVLVRIDPLDLQHAYAYDAEKRRWVKGDLITTGIEEDLTLHQYDVIRKHARDTQQPDEGRLDALARARGELFDFVKEIIQGNKKSKARKRFARFYADGRKPAEHIAETIVDPAKSASRLSSHPIDSVEMKSPPPPLVPEIDDAEIEPLNVRRRQI